MFNKSNVSQIVRHPYLEYLERYICGSFGKGIFVMEGILRVNVPEDLKNARVKSITVHLAPESLLLASVHLLMLWVEGPRILHQIVQCRSHEGPLGLPSQISYK